jgi:hypothetical protein
MKPELRALRKQVVQRIVSMSHDLLDGYPSTEDRLDSVLAESRTSGGLGPR